MPWLAVGTHRKVVKKSENTPNIRYSSDMGELIGSEPCRQEIFWPKSVTTLPLSQHVSYIPLSDTAARVECACRA